MTRLYESGNSLVSQIRELSAMPPWSSEVKNRKQRERAEEKHQPSTTCKDNAS